jgi:hypothetical protein
LVTYVDFICFDVSNAFHIVPHSLLPHKISGFTLSGGYANWFRGYLSNEKCQVRVSGILSSHFDVLSGIPQGSEFVDLDGLRRLIALKISES